MKKYNYNKQLKTTDIKGNHAGYSQSFGEGVNQIYIYKDLCIKDWRVAYNYGLRENGFWYKQEAVDFANTLIKKQKLENYPK